MSALDEAVVRRWLETLERVEVVDIPDASFFFVRPPDQPSDHMHPFATIVRSDAHDMGPVSDLARSGVYRLNVGVARDTYRSRFGPLPPTTGAAPSGGHDFTALDRLLPHPVYGAQGWVCVLSPSEETFREMQLLLAEAHGLAAAREERRAARRDG